MKQPTEENTLPAMAEQTVKKYPTIVVRVSEAQKERFYNLGGADWLRKKIETSEVEAL